MKPRTPSRSPERARSSIAGSRLHADEELKPAPVPRTSSLDVVRKASMKCRACPLWKLGTCTVFREGNPHARIVLVGEQPGDVEDREGRPFVGPAGRMLDKAMADACIPAGAVYKTNAVKHFKWEPKGERRMHKTPSEREIAACRPWLEAELEILKPDMIIAMGRTAARSVLGKGIAVMENRGKVLRAGNYNAGVTVHPSMLLRIPDRQARHEAYAQFVADLKHLSKTLASKSSKR